MSVHVDETSEKISPREVVLIGAPGVGKTNFLVRLGEGAFRERYDVTVGVEDKLLKHDASQFRMRELPSGDICFDNLYYRNADSFLLFVDLSSKDTRESSISYLQTKDLSEYFKRDYFRPSYTVVFTKSDRVQKRDLLDEEYLKLTRRAIAAVHAPALEGNSLGSAYVVFSAKNNMCTESWEEKIFPVPKPLNDVQVHQTLVHQILTKIIKDFSSRASKRKQDKWERGKQGKWERDKQAYSDPDNEKYNLLQALCEKPILTFDMIKKVTDRNTRRHLPSYLSFFSPKMTTSTKLLLALWKENNLPPPKQNTRPIAVTVARGITLAVSLLSFAITMLDGACLDYFAALSRLS